MTFPHPHMWPTAFAARSRSIFDWENIHKIISRGQREKPDEREKDHQISYKIYMYNVETSEM
jgi:hypothetical protein